MIKKKINLQNLNNILTLNTHSSFITILKKLSDNRLLSSSIDSIIIIYNKITFKPEIIIKEHKNTIYYIELLKKKNFIASCSKDLTIKIFEIFQFTYKLIHTLLAHTESVYKVIELKNENLLSCSFDKTIKLWKKKENNYFNINLINNNFAFNILEIKENIIVYDDVSNMKINFYDLNNNLLLTTLNFIYVIYFNIGNRFCLINENILLYFGYNNTIYIIDINKYEIKNIITYNDSYIVNSYKINENEFLTGDYNGCIKHWVYENDNIKFLSCKNNIHLQYICSIVIFNSNYILTGSGDKLIKLWKFK